MDRTDGCDVSIDTVNSAEVLADSHIAERVPEYILRQPESMEVHTIDTYVPPDSNEDDGMYQFMDNYVKWDKSTNTFSANDMGRSHTFMAVDTNDSTNESIKLDSCIGKRQS